MSIPGPFPLDSVEVVDQATAIKDALSLSYYDVGAGPDFSPLTPFITTELRRHQTEASTIRTLTILGFGDSMCARSLNQVFPTMEDSTPIVGYALGALRYLTLSGTILPPAANSGDSGAATEPTMWDTGAVWLMSSGSSLKIGRTLGGASASEVYGKNITVWCSKQVGGGTLTVAYSVDGGSSYTNLGTIDTSTTTGSALDMARGTFALGGDRYAVYRVTASGGPVNLIGAKIWDSTRSGVILAMTSMGGIPISGTTVAPSAIRNQIAADLGTTSMWWMFRETAADTSQAQLDTAIDGWLTAFQSTYTGPGVTIPNAEIVIVSQHTRHDIVDTDTPAMRARYVSCASTRPNVKMFDMDNFLPSWDYMDDNGWFWSFGTGWAQDYIHLSDFAWRTWGAEIIDRIIRPAVAPVLGIRTTTQSGTEEINYGSARIDKTQYREHLFAVDYATKGRLGMVSRKLDGNVARVGIRWQPPTDTYLPNGFIIENFGEGGSTWPIVVDQFGFTVMGPFDATNAGGSARGARLVVDENTTSKACLLLKHTSATATYIFKVQDSTAADVMTVDRLGALTTKSLVLPPDSQTATTAAVSIVTTTTALTTTAPAQAITLANGVAGQVKTITHVATSGSGTAVLTPATKTGYTTVTFAAVGDTVTMQYFATIGWIIISSRGVVIA